MVDDHERRAPGRLDRFHLTLLAATPTGYQNLVKLCSAGFLDGYQRGKPSVDLAQLSGHADGVIALTGCLQSRFCQLLIDGRPADARAHADELMQTFGPEDVYFEVQKNGVAAQDQANEGIVRIAREVGRPLVGTGDVHYLRREDYSHHAALLCVQTKSTLSQPKISFDANEFYLRSSEEMARSFAEWPEAIASTVEIAERCDVELELGRQLIPRYPTPGGESEGDYLRSLVLEGLRFRYGEPPPAEAIERAEYELEVIERMGFSGYFLIVWDFVKYAKDSGIAVGPGRGSAAGSLVAYSLQITDVDPLALRPAVRALPQPRARVDAGHRHRLLGARPRAGDPLRDRQVRQGVGGADRDLRQDVPAGRDARCSAGPRPRLRRRGPPGQADPRSDHGPAAELRGLPEAGPAPARRGRPRSHRPPDRRCRPGSGGDRAQLLDPRRGRGDRRPPADRHRPASDRRRGERRERRAGVPDRDAVLDEAGRAARAAQDGLPGTAQPGRDRGRARHHRALDRASVRTWRPCRSITRRPTR